MSNNFRAIVKSLVYSTFIISSGYVTMILVTPTADDLKKTIDKEHLKKGLKQLKSDREVYALQVKTIIENSKSDRPIWDVK